jgi:hypothetical protein
MNTPPISRKRSYVSTPENQGPIVSTPPTLIVPYYTPKTVIVEEPIKSSTFEGPGRNLRNEFAAAATMDDAATDDDATAKDEYLKDKIKYVEDYLDDRKKRYKAEQHDRVEETAQMKFGLPAKKGGRRSKKAQRKHRKKTSKRKSRK